MLLQKFQHHINTQEISVNELMKIKGIIIIHMSCLKNYKFFSAIEVHRDLIDFSEICKLLYVRN